MRDIYSRDPQDRNYNPKILEVTDTVEICIGQLKMMLLTQPGSVLGDPRFGLDLEGLLFELGLSEKAFKKELDLHLSIYCPLFLKVGGTYEVKFYVGKYRDIAILDFAIPQDGGLSPLVTLRVK